MSFEITPLNTLAKYLHRLTEARLWTKVIIGLVLGIGAGIALHPEAQLFAQETSTTIGNWLALPGKLFLKLVQMIMIPLILTSIITGMVSNTNGQLKSMGLKLVLYFVLTTSVAILIGTFLTLWLKPGALIFSKGAFQLEPGSGDDMSPVSPFQDIPKAISDLIPENPLASMVTGEMLSIVVFSIIIGIAVTQLAPKTVQPIARLLHSVQEICMTIVSWAMLLVPYAVFGLIAQLVSGIGLDGLKGIGYFMLVVLIGLLGLMFMYLILVGTIGKMNPFSFMRKIREVQLLAFSTTSSAAVMPLSMKTADEKLGVSSKVSDFIIPIGATINMDGTALFQCVSAIFIAQAYGMEIGFMGIMLIMVTIVAASIGTPAIPGGGVIVLASVLQSVGIPAEGLVIIVGVERILGMFRTAVNVTGDLTACLVFDKIFKGSVPKETPA
jgi:Na+/H+-dicarboxylate symporter